MSKSNPTCREIIADIELYHEYVGPSLTRAEIEKHRNEHTAEELLAEMHKMFPGECKCSELRMMWIDSEGRAWEYVEGVGYVRSPADDVVS